MNGYEKLRAEIDMLSAENTNLCTRLGLQEQEIKGLRAEAEKNRQLYEWARTCPHCLDVCMNPRSVCGCGYIPDLKREAETAEAVAAAIPAPEAKPPCSACGGTGYDEGENEACHACEGSGKAAGGVA